MGDVVCEGMMWSALWWLSRALQLVTITAIHVALTRWLIKHNQFKNMHVNTLTVFFSLTPSDQTLVTHQLRSR